MTAAGGSMPEEARRQWWPRLIARRGLLVFGVIAGLATCWVGLSVLLPSRTSPGGTGAGGAAASVGPAPAPVEGAGPEELQVVISKSRRLLVVFRGTRQIRSFRMVLGSEPNGDKQREGDGRTPVGTFYVCEKNAESKYYLFIGISYPNEEDAERGLADGLITQDQHDAIVQAIAERTTPPWYTRLGGEIGIHGGGTAWDWTRGCLAIDNADMRDLYALIREGTTVVIHP